MIVVDNTNIRRSKYLHYKRVAAEAGYQVIVVSFICSDFDMVKLCSRRCVHDVNLQAISRSWRQWESDEQAIKVNF